MRLHNLRLRGITEAFPNEVCVEGAGTPAREASSASSADSLTMFSALRCQGGGCGRPIRSRGCTAAIGISWSRVSRPEDLVHTLAMTGHGRGHQQGIGRRVQLEMLLRMRQRVVGYERNDVREFGRFRS